MKLLDWMTDNSRTSADVAREVGATTQSVRNWLNGSKPGHGYMIRLRRLTKGAVNPEDFSLHRGKAVELKKIIDSLNF